VNEKQNRFYGSGGDLSTQLSPWQARAMGLDPAISIFRLERDLRFRSDIAGGDIVVPIGFLSDLASIPRIAWTLFADPDANFMEMGAWVHDLLYGHIGNVSVICKMPDTPRPRPLMVALTRKQCDRILCYEAMPDLGAAPWQIRAVYWALRIGGRSNFNTEPPAARWGAK
jgi:hypothetical protein